MVGSRLRGPLKGCWSYSSVECCRRPCRSIAEQRLCGRQYAIRGFFCIWGIPRIVPLLATYSFSINEARRANKRSPAIGLEALRPWRFMPLRRQEGAGYSLARNDPWHSSRMRCSSSSTAGGKTYSDLGGNRSLGADLKSLHGDDRHRP